MPAPIKAILLDMDGVLYHGNRALDGAIKFMQHIAGVPHCFITNNPIRLPGEVADLLEELGFTRPDTRHIITSGIATARYLASRKAGFRYFAVGAEGLHRALAEVGTDDPVNADFVVVGEGAGLDYQSLTTGLNLILKQGATLISTNPDDTVDATVDGNHVVLPGGGSLVAPFIKATGRQPLTIGKPEPLLYQVAMQKLGVTAENCLMIGDRPDTDILGAARLGMKTALVRTGRFARDCIYPAEYAKPDYDVESLAELEKLLEL
jgi:HAD superfamily hydrolase (TIGR01450 family)